MGRAKLKMELIDKEKSRLLTFKKRKEGLIRKIHEFTTLCDVSACMIIYGPKQEPGSETWPENRDEVKRVIDVYRAKNRDLGNRTYGLPDFFQDRKRKLEDELKKMRKKNMEAKYPTWPEFMNHMPEARLRGFATDLRAKAERVRAMIEQMKMRLIQQVPEIMMDRGVLGGGYYNNAPHQMHLADYYPTAYDPMMMLPPNGEYSNCNNNGCGNFLCGPPLYDQPYVYNDPTNPSLPWDGQQRPVEQYYDPGSMLYVPGTELECQWWAV